MKTTFFRRRVRNITLLLDLILVNVAFMAAYYVRYKLQWFAAETDPAAYTDWIGQQFLYVLLIAVIFWRGRVWDRRRGEFWIDEMSRLTNATTTAIAGIVTLAFFILPEPFSRLMYVWTFLFTIGFLAFTRFARRVSLSILYARGVGVDNVLVIGAGEVGRGVIRTLLARPDLGLNAIGYLHDGRGENNLGSGRIPHLGDWSRLKTVISKNREVDQVFIALPADQHDQTLKLVRQCHDLGVRPQVVPDLFELSLSRVEFNNMAGIPVFSVRDLRISRWGLAVKRLIDLAICIAISPIFALVTAIIGAAIKLESPGPIFFAQKRIGKDGKPFTFYKFRSMVVDAEDRRAQLEAMNEADGPIFKIREDPRLTRVGKFIRRLSLDELPQIWNVWRGDMSLVGPRPPLPSEVAKYQPWHRERLAVKGGMTGLWQTSGRSDLTFDEQCLLDIYYIENWSLPFDFRLIFQTIPYVLFGKGAY